MSENPDFNFDFAPQEIANKPLTDEELLQMVLCEGEESTFTEQPRFTVWGFPQGIPQSESFNGIIDRVRLTEDEWHRLGRYLFEKHGIANVPPLAAEEYCRNIINKLEK